MSVRILDKCAEKCNWCRFVQNIGSEVLDRSWVLKSLRPHCKQIRKIYGRITGNQLPVPVPLFLREPVKYLTWQDRIVQDSVTYGSVAI